MKKQLFLLLLCMTSLLIKAQTVNFTQSNLPIILINTNGQTINDSIRIITDMGIIDNGVGAINFATDSANDFNGKISIEIRGSTSQQYPKKSYGFSTVWSDSTTISQNVVLLGMPSENDWILYAPYPDKTLIRNTFAYYTFRRMGHYASRTRLVELLRNGGYRGVYELHERIKRDKNRVDVSKLNPQDTLGDQLTGGYIIKIDKVTGDSGTGWDSHLDSSVHFLHHYPEEAEMQASQIAYIKNYVHDFEESLNSPNFQDSLTGYRKYISTNSFVDFFLMQELGRTVDGYRSSTFMHKDRDSLGGKLKMGPLWDFNLSFGNADYCEEWDTLGWHYLQNNICNQFDPHIPFWWEKLLTDPYFTQKVKCRWTDFRTSFLHTDSVFQWVDSMALMLDSAQTRNFERWQILGQYVNWNYYVGETYADEISYFKTWLAGRLNWLDNNLPGSGPCTAPVSVAHSLSDALVKIYPNPIHNEARIEIYDRTCDRFVLYDVLGKPVKTLDIHSPITYFSKENLSSGMYFYHIFAGETLKKTGKVWLIE